MEGREGNEGNVEVLSSECGQNTHVLKHFHVVRAP